MCSFSEFYYKSPDGLKALILTLPFMTVVACVWLWPRRKSVVRVVTMTEAQLHTVAKQVALLLQQRNYPAIREREDRNRPPRLNPPKDQEED